MDKTKFNIEDKLSQEDILNQKTCYRLSLLLGLVSSLSGMIAVSSIDNKLWKYSVSSWCLSGTIVGFIGTYKNMDIYNKIKLHKFCYRLGSCFI
jgi:hypothetical protein